MPSALGNGVPASGFAAATACSHVPYRTKSVGDACRFVSRAWPTIVIGAAARFDLHHVADGEPVARVGLVRDRFAVAGRVAAADEFLGRAQRPSLVADHGGTLDPPVGAHAERALADATDGADAVDTRGRSPRAPA